MFLDLSILSDFCGPFHSTSAEVKSKLIQVFKITTIEKENEEALTFKNLEYSLLDAKKLSFASDNGKTLGDYINKADKLLDEWNKLLNDEYGCTNEFAQLLQESINSLGSTISPPIGCYEKAIIEEHMSMSAYIQNNLQLLKKKRRANGGYREVIGFSLNDHIWKIAIPVRYYMEKTLGIEYKPAFQPMEVSDGKFASCPTSYASIFTYAAMFIADPQGAHTYTSKLEDILKKLAMEPLKELLTEPNPKDFVELDELEF